MSRPCIRSFMNGRPLTSVMTTWPDASETAGALRKLADELRSGPLNDSTVVTVANGILDLHEKGKISDDTLWDVQVDLDMAQRLKRQQMPALALAVSQASLTVYFDDSRSLLDQFQLGVFFSTLPVASLGFIYAFLVDLHGARAFTDRSLFEIIDELRLQDLSQRAERPAANAGALTN